MSLFSEAISSFQINSQQLEYTLKEVRRHDCACHNIAILRAP